MPLCFFTLVSGDRGLVSWTYRFAYLLRAYDFLAIAGMRLYLVLRFTQCYDAATLYLVLRLSVVNGPATLRLAVACVSALGQRSPRANGSLLELTALS